MRSAPSARITDRFATTAPSARATDRVVTTPPQTAAVSGAPARSGPPLAVIGLGLMTLSGLAAAFLLLRRRDGGAAMVAVIDPDAPSRSDALDAELHEMIAELEARELEPNPAKPESDDRREVVRSL